MGDAAVGLITMHHYHADLDNAENKRFVAAWKKDYGANSTPDFMAVGGYDGMAAIVHVDPGDQGQDRRRQGARRRSRAGSSTARAARSRSIRTPATSS